MPHFVIKNHFQRREELYQDILSEEILSDVCLLITGSTEYTLEYDNTGYNIGRLAILEHEGSINYISFSEFEIRSRNSFFQSFPSALVRYHQDDSQDKNIFFYFLPPDGNIETSYFEFMYRLMKTAGTIFLNELDYLNNEIVSFNSIADIIAQKNLLRDQNRSNNSSYVTIGEDDAIEIYGKTYGASKYETTLLTLAVSKLTTSNIRLYEIPEGNLRQLPNSAREVIVSLGIEVITSDLSFERQQYNTTDSFRSPTYIFNLLEKLGDKKCALCDCEIPQIVQGAHIWPVASIKRLHNINQDQKLQYAINGNNGIWLCNNHHKLFDIDMLFITQNGRIKYKTNIEDKHEEYLLDITTNNQIAEEILTPAFLGYLERRNNSLDEQLYSLIE